MQARIRMLAFCLKDGFSDRERVPMATRESFQAKASPMTHAPIRVTIAVTMLEVR